jgi:hypothetical protein
MTAGQFAKVIIDQRGIDLVVMAFDQTVSSSRSMVLTPVKIRSRSWSQLPQEVIGLSWFSGSNGSR